MGTQATNYDNGPEFNQEEEGQIIESPDVGTLAILNKSEIDQQIATAKKYPRSIKGFLNDAIALATLDEQTAGECIYALPRAGKAITGPSARLAEIILHSWGNVRGGARVVAEEEEFIVAQGMFYDLEKNVAIAYEVKRRIVDKYGKRYNGDMIGVTGNAACSIAFRNSVFKGIPKALWRKVEDAARKTIAGDIKTLATKRANALQAFAAFGVTHDMVFRALNIRGSEDITIEHLVNLAGMLTALKEGETTIEDLFAQNATAGSERAAVATEQREKELINKYPAKTENPQPPSQESQPEAPATASASPSPESRHQARSRNTSAKEPSGVPIDFNR